MMVEPTMQVVVVGVALWLSLIVVTTVELIPNERDEE